MKNENMISEMTGNGTRALILGCACVIVSKLTPAEIEKFSIYRPEALQMKDEHGEVVFTVDVSDGGGHIERDSAVYSRATTADGRATITLLTDPECEDRKETVLLAVGSGLSLPDELENHLFSLLPDLEKESQRAWDFIDQL